MANNEPTETTALLADSQPPEPSLETETLLGNVRSGTSKTRKKELPQPFAALGSPASIEVEIDNGEGLYITQSLSSLQNSSKTPVHLRTSNLASLMHLLKGNIGTGVLAMPSACKYAGLWAGPVGVLVIGFIATHCMHMLVNCSRKLCKRREGLYALGYAEILEESLRTGPPRLQRFHRHGRYTINGFLLLTQFGFCCVYILFIAQNIQQVVNSFHSNGPDVKVYLLVSAALLIPYCFVKNLKHLAPFSTFANLLVIVGLVIVFQELVQGLPDVSTRPAILPVDKLPLYFGTAMFAFEAIGLVMPIENKMRHPEDFGGCAGILNLGMTFVVCLYTAMGFYGYLKYGDQAEGSITLNLPGKNWLFTTVNLMYAMAIFISYGLQFYVVVRIIWPALEAKISSRKAKIVSEYIFRTALVLGTCGISMVVPHLDLMISLVGSLASSSLALMFPPLIEIITYSAEGERLSAIKVFKNVLIILLGIVGFATGTFAALNEIIRTFQDPSGGDVGRNATMVAGWDISHSTTYS
ncbi:proton-coupled amino acid transporter 2-like [Mizuhopecten yessoensis]|uniref:Proton-coupled amino acid transporter 1 n=1 Tax=Mizuhopecten yessoensis TaxID=6573 RepID=A0A210QVW5_MIZYE|nr:proton-coupled amino acid transporter 2-like [Mizuhopecten yessoensis]OWF52908.1 Proton-coupled amino acid transporter 1 [Mizuhopecten yessoensis]